MLPCTGIADHAVQTARFSLQKIPRKKVLCKQVDRSATALRELQHYLVSIHHLVEGATGILESCEPKKPLDPDGAVAADLEKAEALLEEAVQDMDGWPGNGEKIRRAWSSTAAALRRLHDATVRLRWAILEHDADLAAASPRSYTPSEIDELIADLGS